VSFGLFHSSSAADEVRASEQEFVGQQVAQDLFSDRLFCGIENAVSPLCDAS